MLAANSENGECNVNEAEISSTSERNQLDDTLAGIPDPIPLIRTWLSEETWPTPKWYITPQESSEPRRPRPWWHLSFLSKDNKKKRAPELRSYESYLSHHLRSRYFELESDFRTILSNDSDQRQWIDVYSGDRIFTFLRLAKHELEKEQPNLLEVSHLLDLVERYMPWIMPPQVLVGRRYGILSQLRSCASEEVDLAEKINATMETTAKDYWNRTTSIGDIRGFLDQAIGVINQYNLKEQISAGLQIERLKSLRLWGILILFVLLLVSPLVTDITLVSSELWLNGYRIIDAWTVAVGITVIGAVGGFLSGLLQVRDSKATLTQYQESVLKFHLKPIVGALLALMLFILLSWQILPGISIENLGSYVMFAFLAGFSERYFLRLLKLEPDGVQSNDS